MMTNPEAPSPNDKLPIESAAVDNPLSSANDRWTGDPEMDRALLVHRSFAAIERSMKSQDEEPRVPTKGWLRRLIG